MKNMWNRTVSSKLTSFASILLKWLGGALVLNGLYRLVVDNHPQLDAWEYVVAAVLLGLSLVQIAIAAKVRRSQRVYPSSLFELDENLVQATCVLGCAFCAWIGLWSLVLCFCGISLFYGISQLTRAQQREGYTLLLSLADNGEIADEVQHGDQPIWMYLVIDGDGVDIRPYKERPGSLEEYPMSRVLVEYHENQFRILAWSEGANIDSDPDTVEVLVADVNGFSPTVLVIGFEYDLGYFGGDYSGVGSFVWIPVALIERVGEEAAFEQVTGFHRSHIIHWDCEDDERTQEELATQARELATLALAHCEKCSVCKRAPLQRKR